MTHSVSHNLIIELNGNDLTIVTLKKNGLVDELKFYAMVDKPILDSILSALPDIYSDVSLLIRKKDFITIPDSLYASNTTNIFQLSYNLPELNSLRIDKTEYGYGIVFAVDDLIINTITAKFSRLKIKHEATLILSKLAKEVNFKQPKILISINNENIIIWAINEGKLLLCNPFSAKSNDDIFYFVMLTVEQLAFMPGETELVILGEPANRLEIFELFKNYIKEINIWLEEYQTEPDIKNEALLSHSFALQLLVCE